MLKPSVFSSVSLAALLLVVLLTTSAFSNLSLQSAASASKSTAAIRVSDREGIRGLIGSSNSSQVVRLSVEVLEIREDAAEEDPVPVPAPLNATEEERIAWFKANKASFRILHSNRLTRQFRVRAQNFLRGECEALFFMTWIKPAGSFGEREFLAVESLFRAHPAGCLIVLSATMDSPRGSRILKPLNKAGYRVKALAPDLGFLFEKTPAETWLRELMEGKVDPGEIPLAQNLSNLLRLAALYKFGGVYLDTDFIVLKKLSGLRNSIGAQSVDGETGNWTRLNNAILAFNREHPLVYRFIEEFSLTFNGNKWGHNGPYLVSRVVERVQGDPAYDFRVLPPMAFYPVDWIKIGGLFQRPRSPNVARWVSAKLLQLRRETHAIHLWNKQSSRLRIEEGSVMSRVISANCLFCRKPYSS
ncbi:hypothetical protein H6P81_006866 [Aristolochia fimbriata]|uniref:Alpha 1,4-glycosyltransferase domain-containing protein n=1 Tax=Aristolochia fimbriata TaxID=158543 RepID=A0AAV7F2D7_ARIFI|nr:hypothetical protein H6P81_006866 [Aristolochia fimbriata]